MLKVELRSNLSDTTDIEKKSCLPSLPNQMLQSQSKEFVKSQSYKNPLSFNPVHQKPSIVAKRSDENENTDYNMSRFNNHLLEIEKTSKHNKIYGLGKKKRLKIKCRDNCLHTVEVFYKKENEVIVKFLDDCCKKSEFFIDSSICLLYTSPSPRDLSTSRMPSSA